LIPCFPNLGVETSICSMIGVQKSKNKIKTLNTDLKVDKISQAFYL